MKFFITLIALGFYNYIGAQSFSNEITILQNGTTKNVSSENDFITLKKEPFKIQFQSKFHHTKKENFNGLKATIVINEDDLPVIEEGTTINLIPFFEEFSRIPTDDDGFYSALVINEYVHHYLFYENDVNKSVDLLSQKNEVGLLEWTINRFYLEGKEFPVQQMKHNKLTFILLNDFNSNKIIDTDELRIVRINFE